MLIGFSILATIAIGAWYLLYSGETDPDRLFRKAREDLAAKRFDRVDSDLIQLSKLRPPTSDDRLLRAELYRLTGRDEQAIGELSEIPDRFVNASAVRFAQGLLELRLDRARLAEVALRKALELDPNKSDARRELVRIATIQDRLDVVSTQFTALSQQKDVSLEFDELYLWTLGRSRTTGPAEYAETLKRWVAADPEDRPSRLGLASAFRKLGKVDEAEAILSTLKREANELSPAERVLAARVAIDQVDLEKAHRLLDSAKPGDAEMNLLHGQLYLVQSRPKEALECLRASLGQRPNDRETLAALSTTLQRLGKQTEARPIISKVSCGNIMVLSIEEARIPAQQRSVKRLGSIATDCEEFGQPDLARAWYRLALKEDPTNATLQKALFRLAP